MPRKKDADLYHIPSVWKLVFLLLAVAVSVAVIFASFLAFTSGTDIRSRASGQYCTPLPACKRAGTCPNLVIPNLCPQIVSPTVIPITPAGMVCAGKIYCLTGNPVSRNGRCECPPGGLTE